MRHSRLVLPCAVAVACVAGTSSAGVISFVGTFDDSGTGFGNVLNVLTVQSNGSEFGSVLRSGGMDVLSGDAGNQSSTRSIAEMQAAMVGFNDFGVVFNINEPGSSDMVTLQAFTIRFYHSSETAFFDLTWTGPMSLAPVSQGTGGAGYLFSIALTPAEQALFFADTSNRLGIIVPEGAPITNSFNGPENFYMVPGPGAASLAGLGLLLALRRRRPA